MKKDQDKPLRIAHIIGKWVGGGVEAVVMNYYRHIDHAKIQFDFICDSDSTNIPYDEIEKLGGKVILVSPYQHIISYLKELKVILKEGKYRIVHSHINALSVFPLYAAKKVGVPIRIAHSHSTTNKKEWKKNLLKQILRPFSKRYATDYICCSELAGRWLFGDKVYDNGEVYLLNNAIDLDKFAYDEDVRKAKRKELNISDDTLVIGHIGRFVAQKNHTFLIDIFNELHKENKNSLLLLAGQGPLIDEIKNKVNDLNLTESVKFLGQRNDVNELYQAFDVFLLPSLYEGLGMVAVEAQCAGNYCICSTEVPSIIKMTDSVEFLSLNDKTNLWVQKILNCNMIREDHSQEIKEIGYDIKTEAKLLEKKYFNYKSR
ncbi:MAG: glycosyltransferase family 1 protein [Bacilli bacterium]|nr:glycosyltransferase family 1 protein [Bacilli bacterium]